MLLQPLRRLLLGGGLVAMLGAATTRATEDRLAELELEELLEVPVESVSGVSTYEQSIRRAPAGVTVFTAEDFRRQGWRTLADALRAAPGMHVRNDRFYEYLGNRGFTRPLDYNSRTLVLVDGHRVNDAIYQQGAIGTEFILDAEMIERVEIIQGPGSSVYGSSAFFGAINVVPRRGRAIGGGEVSTTFNAEPGAKVRVAIGDRTAGGLDYTFSFTEEHSRGETDFRLDEAWRAEHPSFAATRVGRSDGLRRRLAYGHAAWRGMEAEGGYVQRRKDVLPPVYFTAPHGPANAIDERGYISLRTRREVSGDDELAARVAVDVYRYEGEFAPAVVGLQTLRPEATAVSVGGEARWLRALGGGHRLLAGVDYRADLRQDLERKNANTGRSEVRVRQTSSHASPYAQLDWELAPPLVLSLGGRVDAQDDYDPRVSPRAGLIWEACERTTLKLLYGESFRTPNIEERYAGEAGVVANPDLAPERNRAWELLGEHRWSPAWRAEARLYSVDSRDLITSFPTGTNPAVPDETMLINAQTYRTRGGDLTLVGLLPSGLQLRASVTLQKTEDTGTGLEVADAPTRLGKLSVSAPLGRPGVRLSGEVQHVSERRAVDGTTAEAYTVANVTLRFAPVWRRWDVAFSVYNATDAEWSDPKNRGVIANPPRGFALRATCAF